MCLQRVLREREFTTEEFTAKDAAVAMYTFDFGKEGMYDKNPHRLLNSALDSKDKKKGSPRRLKG